MVWFICSRQLPINKFFTAGVDIKLQCASPTAHLHWCVTFLVSGLKQLTLATSHFREGTVFWLHQQATISSVALDITHFHISTYQFPKSEFQKQFSKSKPSVPVSASRSHSSQVKWHPLTYSFFPHLQHQLAMGERHYSDLFHPFSICTGVYSQWDHLKSYFSGQEQLLYNLNPSTKPLPLCHLS